METSNHSGPVYHRDLGQGTEQWLEARCGLPTASEMKFIVTPLSDTPQSPRSAPPAASRGSDAPTQPEATQGAPSPPTQTVRERVSNACLAMAKTADAGALENLWSGAPMSRLKAAVEGDDELREILHGAYRDKAASFTQPPAEADGEIPY